MIKISFYIIMICLYNLLCIYVYMMHSISKEKRINKKLESIDIEIGKLIANEIENVKENKEINSNTISKIKKLSKRPTYKKYLCDYLLNKLDEDKDTVIEFVKRTNILGEVLNSSDNKSSHKLYKIKYIGEFKIDRYFGYLVENCKDNSIYIQIACLKALSKLGDIKYFLDGLENIVNTSTLIHEKILVENIRFFEGNRFELNKLLEENLKIDNNELKKIILTYFIEIKYEQGENTIYELMKKSYDDKEILISCIKYFIRIKSIRVKLKLMNLLEDSNWEVRALSAIALKNYEDKEVIHRLKESIKDENWYVRQNSADSLYTILKDKNKILDIIYGNDRYASDAILTILSEVGNLEEYISDISEISIPVAN